MAKSKLAKLYSLVTGLNIDIDAVYKRLKTQEEKDKFAHSIIWTIKKGAAFDNLKNVDEDDLNESQKAYVELVDSLEDPNDDDEVLTPEDKDNVIDVIDEESSEETTTTTTTEEPEPEWEESTDYDLVDDETSFNASLANGALAKYYAKYPDEDRWNTVENRACNFNDKVYDVSIDEAETEEFAAHWETDNVQSITNGTDKYYLDMFYSLDANTHELFADVACTETTGKSAVFTAIKWNDETCPHCYEGAINAPGSTLKDSAWICPNFDSETTKEVKFEYENEVFTPWSKAINWGVASAKKDLGITEFDKTKLVMLVK